jgi:uncharacterized protein
MLQPVSPPLSTLACLLGIGLLSLSGCASTGLQRAVQQGNLVVVQKATLKDGSEANLNSTDRTGRTLLSHAAERGHVEIIESLIAQGAEVDRRDVAPEKSIEAQQAWRKLSWKTRNLLDGQLRRGGTHTIQMTPLAVAAQNNQLAAVKVLLQAGADIESANGPDNRTPLLVAARAGRTAVTEYLLAEGANPQARNSHNHTALSLLANNPNSDGNADLLGTASLLIAALHPPRQPRSIFLSYLNNLADSDISPAALHGAAANGHYDLVRLLLDTGANPRVASADGQTALALAAANGHQHVAERLLESGANVNGQGNIHIPLHDAIRNQYLPLVNTLLAAKAQTDILVQPGTTPLLTAVRLGREDIVESLLNARANPDFTAPQSNAPLAIAVAQHKVGIIRQLLEANANPNIPWRQGEDQASLLVLAVKQNHVDTTAMLLGAKALPDLTLPDDNTALFYAVAAQQEGQVAALLQAGANPNHLQPRGEVSLPIQKAVQLRHVGIAQQLLQAGASPNPASVTSPEDIKGVPPLQIASIQDDAALISLLLQHGADPNIHWQQEEQQLTPLLIAINRKQPDLIKQLLAVGADPNLGHSGAARHKALHLAEHQLNPALVRDLLSAGADSNAKIQGGNTALSIASFHGRKDNVEILLARGADPNLADDKGFSPVYLAIQNKHLDIVRMLLAAGANPNLATTGRWTPLHKAAADEYTAGFHVLLASGADRTLKNGDGRTADDIIRIREEERARKRAEEAAERQRKEQARAQFMAGMMQVAQEISNDYQQQQYQRQQQQAFQDQLRAQAAQAEADRIARETAAVAAARRQQQEQAANYQQSLALAQQQAQAEQAARQAELARQRAEAQARATQQEAERRRRIAEQEREAQLNAQRLMRQFVESSQVQNQLTDKPAASSHSQEIREYNANYTSMATAWCYQYPQGGRFICDGPLQRLHTSYSDLYAALKLVACSGAGEFAQPPAPGESRQYGCGYKLGGAHNRVMPDISPFP